MKPFPNVKMIKQYYVLGKRIDLYLPDHKLATEIDEKGHQTEKKKKKKREETKQKNNFVVNLSELVLIVKNSRLISKLVKYTVTLVGEIKN